MSTESNNQNNLNNNIMVPISPGELIDKITILEIKQERIKDEKKLVNITHELNLLNETRQNGIPASDALTKWTDELKIVNEKLWDIEDDIRQQEKQKTFETAFIELARAVYITNDRRSVIKREINELLGSKLVEEKSYEEYE